MLTKTENFKPVIEFLNEDPIVNLNIIGVIENMPNVEVYVDDINNPKGVFIEDGYMHYMYSKDNKIIDEMCDAFFKDGFYGLAGVEESITKRIKGKYEVTWDNPCDLYYLTKEKLDESLIKNPVRSIDIKDAEIVDKYYEFRHPGSIEAIKEDIRNRPSSAVYVEGELACWVLVHKDNSMGIMYTREEYRRRGYAVDVTIDLASKILASGKIPYLQIINRNNMSPGLAKKCGFIKYGKVYWCGVMVGTPKEIIDGNNEVKDKFIGMLNEEQVQVLFKHRTNYDGMYSFLYGNECLEKNEEDDIDFTLKEVKSEEDFKIWLDMLSKGYEISNENKILNETLRKELYGQESKHTLYIGILNGEPVSCSAMLKIDHDFSGLTMLTVKPEMRNKGIWEKTIFCTLIEAKKRGVELVALQSPKECSNMFKKVGFKVSN